MKDLKLIALVNFINNHTNIEYKNVIFISDLLHLAKYGRPIANHKYIHSPGLIDGQIHINLLNSSAIHDSIIFKNIIIHDEDNYLYGLLSESEIECIEDTIDLFDQLKSIINICINARWDSIFAKSDPYQKIPFKLICNVVGGQKLIKYIENHTLEGDPWNE